MFSESRKRRDVGEDAEQDDMEIVGETKKRRMPAGEDIGPKLVKMIKRLDEDLNGTSIESAIEKLANILEENLDPYEGQIIHILYECAAYLPEKITIFSTLVGLLNARSSDFGEKLLAKFFDEFHHTFVTGDYDISLRLATFLCDLGNAYVVTPNSIVDFLEDFVDLATDENIKSDFFVYIVLHTLPWIGPELNEKCSNKLNDLLDHIALYLGKRQKSHINLLQVWTSIEYPQQDYLDSLWRQLQKLREENWIEKHILRTYLSFDSTLAVSKQIDMPSLNRDILKDSKNHPLPRVVFRLFDQSDCPESEIALPASDAIGRFLVEEDLNWIIDNNYLDWKLCARSLLNYHRKETVPLNYIIIETVFGQLFRLPSSPHIELFYGALLIELCRSEANTMPQVLALAAELLYQRTDTMQPACLDRFVDWFSYHLSNFEYKWSWSDWAECVEFDSLHPKRIFVREVIEKCLRLSYYKKLAEFLPSDIAPIIPDEPTIVYVLDDDQHPAYSKAEQIKDLLMRKAGDDELLAALKVPSSGEAFDAGQTEENYSIDAVAIFFSVLLKLSSKTMTHSFAALTRYHKTLSTLSSANEKMQSIILRTLYDAWLLHKQMMTILVDKMLKMRIIDPAIVISWVFSDEMKVEFKRSWIWDVLSIAVTCLEKQCNNALKKYEAGCIILERLEQRQWINKPNEEMQKNVERLEEEQIENGNEATQESSHPRIAAPNKVNSDEGMELDFESHDAANDTDEMELDARISKQKDYVSACKAELTSCEDSLRDDLLNICHKFTLIITEHLLNCETDGTEIETNFYIYVTGRFKYVFLKHAMSMWHFADELDKELFSSPTIGPQIREIFEQFRSLRL